MFMGTKTVIQLILILTVLTTMGKKKRKSIFGYEGLRSTATQNTKKMCMDVQHTLRARHKSCFLRPDTGPCRAEIIQWYYDVKQKKCYRFFWGGCQGNGNKFETITDCIEYCHLNSSAPPAEIPHYCSLAFDYGTCFGQYYRWGWEHFSKTCTRRLYSGCGGNQNNFETQAECQKTCLTPPNNTLQMAIGHTRTTCFPIDLDAIQ